MESFPFYISLSNRYTHYRITPSRGLSYGAIRFDSLSRKKTLEIKNESMFEFRYLILPINTILSSIDSNMLSAYASGVSAGLRATQIGSDYVSKLSLAAPAAAVVGKKGVATPLASKGGTKTAAATSGGVSIAPYVSPNPLVVEPDTFPTITCPNEPLVLGRFTIHSPFGVVLPGQTVSTECEYRPQGSGIHKEQCKIYISGINPDTLLPTSTSSTSSEHSIQSYELLGESCIPVLSTDITHIFEEQDIRTEPDQNTPNTLTPSTLTTPNSSSNSIHNNKINLSSYYTSKTNTLNFGYITCNNNNNDQHTTTNSKGVGVGVVERIKITNPSKIDAKIHFNITQPTTLTTPTSTSTTGKAAAAISKVTTKVTTNTEPKPVNLGFTVHPQTWDIPPNEHRYVNIYFNPTELKTYNAEFTATVDLGTTDSSTIQRSTSGITSTDVMLKFDLMGHGTLPYVSIEQPSTVSADGNLFLDFGRVHVDYSVERSICIRNDGAFPATCLFEYNSTTTITTGDDIYFPAHGTSLLIPPYEKAEIKAKLSPKSGSKIGDRNGNIKVTVLNNPYGTHNINIIGHVYEYDAYFKLPVIDDTLVDLGLVESIIMPDINLADGTTETIQYVLLTSRCDTALKYTFTLDTSIAKYVTVSPLIGHLPPRATKVVILTFTSTEPIRIDKGMLSCQLQRIQLTDSDPVAALNPNWDCTMSITRLATSYDMEALAAYNTALLQYNSTQDKATHSKDKSKTKKDTTISTAVTPPVCPFTIISPSPSDLTSDVAGTGIDSLPMINIPILEPTYTTLPDHSTHTLPLLLSMAADVPKYVCDIGTDNLIFSSTYMYQTSIHKFIFTNQCNLNLPITWSFEDFKPRLLLSRPRSARNLTLDLSHTTNTTNSTVKQQYICPFSIYPNNIIIQPNSKQEFILKFAPMEVDEYIYDLKATTLSIGKGHNSDPSDTTTTNLTSTHTTNPSTNTNYITTNTNTSSAISTIVSGTSKRPICHFDLIESPQYLTHRNHLKLKNEKGVYAPIEATDVRVVEVQSIGLRTRNTYKFSIVNPTHESYDFIWENKGEINPNWTCIQTSGILYSGQTLHVTFEYIADDTNTSEVFYNFKLPKQNITQLFLFVGQVKEPNIYLTTNKIDFHTVPIYSHNSNNNNTSSTISNSEIIYIKNAEIIPFPFSFEKSLLSLFPTLTSSTSSRPITTTRSRTTGNTNTHTTTTPILDISPRSGVVPPGGQVGVTVTFKPKEEIYYNMNIMCDIKRKPNKLSINIKGEGYNIHPQVQLQLAPDASHTPTTSSSTSTAGGAHLHPPDTGFINLLPTPAINYLDFGIVQVYDTTSRSIKITNHGKYTFDYSYNNTFQNLKSSIVLTKGQNSDTLSKNNTHEHIITYTPKTEENNTTNNNDNNNNANNKITLTIGKYVYNIIILSKSIKPAIKFSTLTYNFGPCFIPTTDSDTTTTTNNNNANNNNNSEVYNLIISNTDTLNNKSITIESLFQKTRSLSVDCPPVIILEALSDLTIPITFTPKEVKEYTFILPFLINNNNKVYINITGSGIQPKIELVDIQQRRISFDNVQVGRIHKKTVKVINRCKRSITVTLPPTLPPVGGKGVEKENREKGDNMSIYGLSHNVTTNTFTVQPKEVYSITIQYTPLIRMLPYAYDFNIQYAGNTKKLLTITGSAQGSEVKLDTEYISFGTVVKQAYVTKRIRLENTGDTTVYYTWNENTFGPYITIQPLQGTLNAYTDIYFDVTFKPTVINNDIQQSNIMLTFNNNTTTTTSTNNSKALSPLYITCQGSCVPPPVSSIERVIFNIQVRQKQHKQIKINNNTNTDWFLSPLLQTIDSESSSHWLVPTTIHVPSKGTADLTVTYHPLKSTPSGSSHNSDLLIPLPDGTALSYTLVGTTESPLCEESFTLTGATRKPLLLSIPIHNWLPTAQKFSITTELSTQPSPATFVTVANVVEVGPNESKSIPLR